MSELDNAAGGDATNCSVRYQRSRQPPDSVCHLLAAEKRFAKFSAKGGRLVRQNPLTSSEYRVVLAAATSSGRARSTRSGSDPLRAILQVLRLQRGLQVAAFKGLRPDELDALRQVNVDLARSRIRLVEQYSAMARTFTLPKNGQTGMRR